MELRMDSYVIDLDERTGVLVSLGDHAVHEWEGRYVTQCCDLILWERRCTIN